MFSSFFQITSNQKEKEVISQHGVSEAKSKRSPYANSPGVGAGLSGISAPVPRVQYFGKLGD